MRKWFRRWKRWTFYNCAPATQTRKRQLPAELKAFAENRPLVIALVEAIGYDLPDLSGYVLLRDVSREGRANVAAYVRCSRFRRRPKFGWIDCEETWPRTDHPGTHPARSIMHIPKFRGAEWIIGHGPPATHGMTSRPARKEHYSYIRGLLHHAKGRAVALCDWNAIGWDEPVSAASMARDVHGVATHSGGIDAGVMVGGWFRKVLYRHTVNGVHLHTDSPHAALSGEAGGPEA